MRTHPRNSGANNLHKKKYVPECPGQPWIDFEWSSHGLGISNVHESVRDGDLEDQDGGRF